MEPNDGQWQAAVGFAGSFVTYLPSPLVRADAWHLLHEFGMMS